MNKTNANRQRKRMRREMRVSKKAAAVAYIKAAESFYEQLKAMSLKERIKFALIVLFKRFK